MLKYILLISFMKKFNREREAISRRMAMEDLNTMPPERVKQYTKLYAEVDDKIAAACLLFKS